MRPVIFLPLDVWEHTSNAVYSAQLLSETASKKPNEPPRCRAVVIDGFLHTSTGGGHGAADDSEFTAWRLIPAEIYKGKTIRAWYDMTEVDAGLRQRGDNTGHLVTFEGRLFVFGPAVSVRASMPTPTTALPLAEVQRDNRCWRSPAQAKDWHMSNGFPVRHIIPAWKGAAEWEFFYRRDGSPHSSLVYDPDLFFGLKKPVHSRNILNQVAKFSRSFPSVDDMPLPVDWRDFRAYYAPLLPSDRQARMKKLQKLLDEYSSELQLSMDRYEALRVHGLSSLSLYALCVYRKPYHPLEMFQSLLTYRFDLFKALWCISVNLQIDLDNMNT